LHARRFLAVLTLLRSVHDWGWPGRISGRGATILEHASAGRIDEFALALSPAPFGSGTGLFEGVR
jgi:hypothetical protein